MPEHERTGERSIHIYDRDLYHGEATAANGMSQWIQGVLLQSLYLLLQQPDSTVASLVF